MGRGVTAAAALAIAIGAGLLAMAVAGAWTVGFSGADEPAHFLNSWFIASYVQNALGSNPMAYAAEYYVHYPKISIGHWPPAYYALLSPFFLILPATPATAFALNLVISSIPALLAALILYRLHGPVAALAGAFACSITPVAVEGYAFFMLDQPIAAAALGATMLWMSYVERPNAWKVIGFALVAAGAVLIKGNAWLLLFVPPIHLLLTGRWPILLSPWPWLAALIAAVIVGPWYWLTAGIAADGFNYAPGLAYAWQALLFNGAAISGNIGLPGLALALGGAVSAWRARRHAPERWNVAAGLLSLVLATLALQSLVPVDLDARYMAPALPPLIVLALIGACAVPVRLRTLAIAAAALLIPIPGVLHLAHRQPKVDLRLEEAAALAGPGSAWVIDGSSGAEGAFTAAMALRDPQLHGYVVRSSRLLAESDFMGGEYRLKASRPEEVLSSLRRLGIRGVVLVRIGGEPAFPHSALLREALVSAGSDYRLAGTLPHRNRPGVTEIFAASESPKPNAPALRALGLPAKAGAVVR